MRIRQVVKKTLEQAGYGISVLSQPLSGDVSLFNEALKIVRLDTMLPRERLVSLFDQVSYCQKHACGGALVECGVWKGGAVALMALAAKAQGGSLPHIHLFDSFQDICEPDPAVDGARAITEARNFTDAVGGRLKPLTGIYDSVGGHGTLEATRHLLEDIVAYPPDLLHYHVGWFQETLPADGQSIGRISILRLDGDWYASTKICLDYLYNQLASGGFLIIDDYGTYEGCKRAVDEFLGQCKDQLFPNRVDAGCIYFIKP